MGWDPHFTVYEATYASTEIVETKNVSRGCVEGRVTGIYAGDGSKRDITTGVQFILNKTTTLPPSPFWYRTACPVPRIVNPPKFVIQPLCRGRDKGEVKASHHPRRLVHFARNYSLAYSSFSSRSAFNVSSIINTPNYEYAKFCN